MDDKRHMLVNVLKRYPESKMIVFVRTQVRVDRVIAHLAKNAMTAVGLHGGLNQLDRDKNLEKFRSHQNITLVATDLSARGIDLPGITHVINYDLPDIPENYVHRIGRTGRGFAKGDAFAFVSPEEAEKLTLVEEFINTKITEMRIDLKVPVATEKEIEDMDIGQMLAHEESQYYTRRKK